MEQRAYADANTTKPERAARQLVEIIRKASLQRFSTREVMRLERTGLGTAAELNPALAFLEEAECIRAIEPSANPRGGRPERVYIVNPALHARTR